MLRLFGPCLWMNASAMAIEVLIAVDVTDHETNIMAETKIKEVVVECWHGGSISKTVPFVNSSVPEPSRRATACYMQRMLDNTVQVLEVMKPKRVGQVDVYTYGEADRAPSSSSVFSDALLPPRTAKDTLALLMELYLASRISAFCQTTFLVPPGHNTLRLSPYGVWTPEVFLRMLFLRLRHA